VPIEEENTTVGAGSSHTAGSYKKTKTKSSSKSPSKSLHVRSIAAIDEPTGGGTEKKTGSSKSVHVRSVPINGVANENAEGEVTERGEKNCKGSSKSAHVRSVPIDENTAATVTTEPLEDTTGEKKAKVRRTKGTSSKSTRSSRTLSIDEEEDPADKPKEKGKSKSLKKKSTRNLKPSSQKSLSGSSSKPASSKSLKDGTTGVEKSSSKKVKSGRHKTTTTTTGGSSKSAHARTISIDDLEDGGPAKRSKRVSRSKSESVKDGKDRGGEKSSAGATAVDAKPGLVHASSVSTIKTENKSPVAGCGSTLKCSGKIIPNIFTPKDLLKASDATALTFDTIDDWGSVDSDGDGEASKSSKTSSTNSVRVKSKASMFNLLAEPIPEEKTSELAVAADTVDDGNVYMRKPASTSSILTSSSSKSNRKNTNNNDTPTRRKMKMLPKPPSLVVDDNNNSSSSKKPNSFKL
jgi:hypothetical protein